MRENIVQISFKKFWERSFAVSCFPPTWYIFQRLGGVLAFIVYKIGLSPNMITLIGGLTGTYAIWQFSVLPLGLLETVHLSLVFSFVYIFIFLEIRVALRLISSYGTLKEKSSSIVSNMRCNDTQYG